MGHVPDGSLPFKMFDFCHDLESALQESCCYDSMHWLYVPPCYEEYRYILGERGERPIICVGVNPSTAEPDKLDRTMKRVKSISEFNGYDGYYMLNVCAQRATSPEDIEQINISCLHNENMKAFEKLFSCHSGLDVWAAWGGSITKRSFFISYLHVIQEIGTKHGVNWFCAGLTKNGHPRHPLFLKKTTILQPFNLNTYLAWCFKFPSDVLM